MLEEYTIAMSVESTEYIEDLFSSLGELVVTNRIACPPQDEKVISSFYNTVMSGKALTEKQANYMMILIKKYRAPFESLVQGSIEHLVNNPKWKQPFRTIDYSKRLDIIEHQGFDCFFAKFPYSVKDDFEKEFTSQNSTHYYDHDRGARLAYPLDINPIQLLEFARKHQFEIAPAVSEYVEYAESIWESEEQIKPYCVLENDSVVIKNAIESAQQYFDEHKTLNVRKDLLLAKSMGFPLLSASDDPLEVICSTEHTTRFHCSVIKTARVIADSDPNKVFVVLDRASDVKLWIDEFVDELKNLSYNVDNVRVCFRQPNSSEEGRDFNQWVKDNNYGGKIQGGKIFIFLHTLPKWVFKNDVAPEFVITNVITSSTNRVTHTYLENSHTVIYTGKFKPTPRSQFRLTEYSGKEDWQIVNL